MTTSHHPRRFAAALVLAAAGATALLGPQAAATAAPATQYIALAYSPGDRQAALSTHANLDTAISGSLARCGARAGHCVSVAWSKNGCVALAVNGDRYHGWHGPTYAAAQNGALQRTGGGSIFMSQCLGR